MKRKIVIVIICLWLVVVAFYNVNATCVQGEIGGQCVAFVRAEFDDDASMMPYLCPPLNVDCSAYHAWNDWNLGYGKGQIPANNSIMILGKWTNQLTGHVAVIVSANINSDSSYSLVVNESNFCANNCEIMDCGVNYTYYPSDSEATRAGGDTRYPVLGFIYGSPFIINFTPIKFTDSSTIYLYSNNQLWPIPNESVYVQLGFRTESCSTVANWSRVVELPVVAKAKYTIRSEMITEAGIPPEKRISYRIANTTCIQGPVEPSKLYVLIETDGETKFHHISNWDIYVDMGFSADSRDIVEISLDLFAQYGEGEAITDENSSFYIAGIGGASLTAPSNLVANSNSTNTINLLFDLPADADSSDQIKVYLNGIYFNTYSMANNLVINNLSANTKYCFRVSIYDPDINLESDKSNQACATTLVSSNPYPIEYEFNQAYPSVYVKSMSGTNIVPERKDRYFRNDNYVTIFTELTDVFIPGSLLFKVKFYAPSGILWQEVDLSEIWLEGDVWRIYVNSNISTADEFGQWKADVYTENIKRATCYFILELDKPAGLALSTAPTASQVNICLDDINIIGLTYEFFRDQKYIGASSTPAFTDLSVVGEQEYRYQIVAVSEEGYRSAVSDILIVDTPTSPIPSPATDIAEPKNVTIISQ